MKPEECIFFQLSNITRNASRYWKSAVADEDVTGVQAMVINFMLDRSPVTASALAETTRLDGATLTGIIDRLCKQELVSREHSPQDRRSVILDLTPQGKRIAKRIRKVMHSANESYLDTLSEKEQSQLYRLINKLQQGQTHE